MSADILRQAADRLDTLADAATPGPWRAIPARDGLPAGVASAEWVLADTDERTADAAYIAAMQPGFASAVAEWLRWTASLEGSWDTRGGSSAPYALATARAILTPPP